MSQTSNRPRRGTPPAQRTSPALAWISALLVVAVFVALGFMLVRRGGDSATAQYAPTPDSFAQETAPSAPTAAAGATAAPAAGAGDVAARNGMYSAPPSMSIDPSKQYNATITTPRGDIVIKLRPDLAPETVNNFVFLAREGFYDGTTWHRVLPNFMAQGGDPSGTGAGGPGYTIKDEYTPETKFDRPGLVAMARTQAPNSAGSQFFITTGAAPWLDGQYTLFGEVTEGQDIVQGIPLRDPEQNPTTPGEQIVKVTIDEE